jgi:hypothetical protein
MALVHTDPVVSKAISLYAVTKLGHMRDETDIDRLKEIYRGWLSYADSESVCQQIRDHMLQAFNETAITIKAKQKNEQKARVVRDPTGERVE